jgi:Zn-dependent peptidase ImmA (M78 family)
MPDRFHSVRQLFDYHDRTDLFGISTPEVELRSVSARISQGNHEYLGDLAERWGISRSALAAQLLETALEEIELHDEGEKQRKAQEAAL